MCNKTTKPSRPHSLWRIPLCRTWESFSAASVPVLHSATVSTVNVSKWPHKTDRKQPQRHKGCSDKHLRLPWTCSSSSLCRWVLDFLTQPSFYFSHPCKRNIITEIDSKTDAVKRGHLQRADASLLSTQAWLRHQVQTEEETAWWIGTLLELILSFFIGLTMFFV